MQLTHERARELIQFKADSALSADSLRMLKAHLDSCDACRAYLDSIHTMEVHLRTAMNRRWKLHPDPLRLEDIKADYIFKSKQRAFLATRLTTIGAALLFFAAGVLGVMHATRTDNFKQPSVGVPLIPTPSVQNTSTITNTAQNCEPLHYEVQVNDTLEFIATKFAVSKFDLMHANDLGDETLTADTELIIPICNYTPTGTVHPPTFTTTITPLSDTPDG